eukprot:15366424-Ditylum_brightwellii.AAC.1
MKGSMFAVLCNLMIQIGSKLSEIATVAKSHIKAKRDKDHHGLKAYTVLEGVFDKHKSSAYQNLKMFPHKSEMAYWYADRVVSKKGSVDSKVARDWSDVFANVVVNPYNCYREQYGKDNNTLKKSNVENLNENLTLHCGQKYTMNELASMFDVHDNDFHLKVEEAKLFAQVSNKELGAWIDEVNTGFHMRHLYSLSNTFKEDEDASCKSFIQHSELIANLQKDNSEMKDMIGFLRE